MAYCTDHLLVIDSQIINDQFIFAEMHMNKGQKYKVLKPLLKNIHPNGVFFGSLTFTWQWLMTLNSVMFLSAFSLLRPVDIKILAVRTL